MTGDRHVTFSSMGRAVAGAAIQRTWLAALEALGVSAGCAGGVPADSCSGALREIQFSSNSQALVQDRGLLQQSHSAWGG
jgi:hypothetical protein